MAPNSLQAGYVKLELGRNNVTQPPPMSQAKYQWENAKADIQLEIVMVGAAECRGKSNPLEKEPVEPSSFSGGQHFRRGQWDV